MRKAKLFLAVVFICSFALHCKDYSIILKRNIFTSGSPPELKNKTSILKPLPPPQLETLIELNGIVYFGEEPSFVIIKEKKRNNESIYKEGEFVGKAKILKIEENKVIFQYNEKTIAINIENKASETNFVSAFNENIKIAVKEKKKLSGVSIPESPEVLEPVTVNFSETVNMLKTDRDLIKNINISPYINEGKVEGFKVTRLPENSIPFQYGLRNGDIIHRANGTLIDSVAKGFSVYNQILNSGIKLVTIEVLRNSQPVILTYHLQ